MPGEGTALLHPLLLSWYRRHRRDFPWRETRDPYRIWVSEVMLQQTQTATALPFYQRFLERFPTIHSLARAREPEVLALWSGLGYYRRARHLLEAARLVVREHAGRVPDDPERFGRLPGVGRYTTGAVLSIAFDRPLPVLDGNVARVLSRVFAVRAAVRDPRGARTLWSLAAALVPARQPGRWNQALMELGATVCMPRAPRCGVCPLKRHCRAFALGRVEDFPAPAPRRATERVRRAVALVTRRDRLLVVKRTGDLMNGLWEPPGVDLRARESARSRLAAELRRLGLTVRWVARGESVVHRITHRAITVETWIGELLEPPSRSSSLRFVDCSARDLPLTALALRLGLTARAAARTRSGVPGERVRRAGRYITRVPVRSR
jgi:A/G-specific adenine glycosylase